MKKISLFALLASLSLAFSAVAHAEDAEFKEPGRWGVMGSVTDDLVKAGVVYYSEHFEGSLFAHFEQDQNQNQQLDTMLKLGYRQPLGHSNYLSYGAEYSPEFAQKIAGTDTSGTFKAGVYVGFQRYFAGDNLLLNFWINPFYYESTQQADGGTINAFVDRHYFQNGGFGVGWMF